MSDNFGMTKHLMIFIVAVISTFSLVIMLTPVARSHGEDKVGPNGGEIRMPGAFHVEMKQRGREFEVYLLDMDFKDPVTVDSSVDIQVMKPDTAAPISVACRTTRAAKPPHFVCLNPKYKPAPGDILKVQAKRGPSVGTEAEYKLPLLQAVAKKPASTHTAPHGGH